MLEGPLSAAVGGGAPFAGFRVKRGGQGWHQWLEGLRGRSQSWMFLDVQDLFDPLLQPSRVGMERVKLAFRWLIP